MSNATPCTNCRRIGFIRQEHIIRGAEASIAYYCGHCNYSWALTEADVRRESLPPIAFERVNRSR
jgi:hypothetical protein